ncbi:UDP-N-acetylglucosamine 1-carboxyvinyltransferase [Candidatus Peregrinibacteria bacterium]|nr:UDP-N-acetylglucosamine 1-carboxyvinyltransferase [Candidatus Peregrinibacteria bacterium]
MPDIEDVNTMLAILRSLGSDVNFRNHTVTIQTRRIRYDALPHALGCKMRASVLLLGPLLAREGYARLPYPGGCVLGARPIDTHASVLRQLGVKKMPSPKEEIIFRGRPCGGEVILPEFSVTGTENALMAAARCTKKTEIRLAALEPHVQDLCRFLQKMGIKIRGAGSHSLSIIGVKNPRGVLHSITPDYLETGTLVLASVLTRGDVTVKNIVPSDLDALWNLLREMKANFALGKNWVRLKPTRRLVNCSRLQTNVFPGYPTDLQPPFVVLMTQAKGQGRVHETLFEGRFSYFPDLKKMGARIEKLNPHEALITGPVKLRGGNVKSWDIRAGAAMILAALAAKGKTVVSDIHYIDRGYERFDEKLRSLGADIVRLD